MTRRPTFQPLARAVLRAQPDDRLVALSREGREAAFEEIVRRYRPGLVAFAAGYAPLDRAEDVVQESFIRSWDALRDSEGEIQLKPWLYTIVRNRALNARRDAKSHQPLPESLDGVRQPSEVALTNEELARVVAAVGALPDAQRRALVRSALDGRTHAQIATEIGATPGAVRQLIHRGRLAVREGAGMIIPLPIVRGLLELGSSAAAATGAAAGGSAVAGTAGGGSLLAKATSVALVGVVAAGSGVAIKHAANSRHQDANTAELAQADGSQPDGGGGPSAAVVTSGPGSAGSIGGGAGNDSASGRGQASGDGDGDGSAGDSLGSAGDQPTSAGSPGGSGGGSGGSGSRGHGGGSGPGHDEAEFEPDEGHSGPGGGGSGHEDSDSDDPPEGEGPDGGDSGSEDFGEQGSGEGESGEGPEEPPAEPGSDEPTAEESGSDSGDGPPPPTGPGGD